ncbi:hypothetical protein [Microbulbifer hainanensis]|uniref:hypothetical protein n=1 Tax=Microbulbifer hainanensis TaxID=2735675 RepID=UPI001867214F|nr:hypothetical protein [Microbulbifer hainanensis]
MRRLEALSIVAVAMALSACASEAPLPIPGLKESFHTEIAANGAKRFTYSLEMQRADIPRPVTAGDANRSRMGREAMRRSQGMRGPGGANALQFDRALKQKLTETGFCRDGYFELDRTIFAGGGEVRGECREGAN